MYLSTYLSIYLSNYLFIYLSNYLFIYLPIYLYMHAYVSGNNLSIRYYLFLLFFFSPFLYMYTFLLIRQSINHHYYLSVCPSIVFMNEFLYAWPGISTSRHDIKGKVSSLVAILGRGGPQNNSDYNFPTRIYKNRWESVPLAHPCIRP